MFRALVSLSSFMLAYQGSMMVSARSTTESFSCPLLMILYCFWMSTSLLYQMAESSCSSFSPP